jgi:hypothetical protein
VKTETSIDWFSVTFPFATKLKDIAPYRGKMMRCKSPIPVYRDAYEILPHGAKILIGSEERLGKHLILSGKVLQSMRSANISEHAMYRNFRLFGGKIGRIDLALDIFDNEEMSVDMFEKRLYDIKTSLVGSKKISGNGLGETLYVGNMKSRSRRLRIYNKGLEQGVSRTWVRVEYEKRRGADKMADTIFSSQRSISSMLKGVIDFPNWAAWQKVIGDYENKVQRGEAVHREVINGAKLNWIVEQAVPALADLMIEDAKKNVNIEDYDITDGVAFETFISALNASLAFKMNNLTNAEKI